jgi:hypothetical protein
MRQRFDALRGVVPSNSQLLLQSIGDKCSSLRETVMVRNRRAFLVRFHNRFISAAYFPQKDLPRFLEITAEDPCSIGGQFPSQHRQFLNKVVDHFQKNPGDLVQTVFRAYKKMRDVKFDFFVTSSVSALFGFYSCGEHCELAMNFLRELVKHGKVKFVRIVLRPFFCNSTTVRFVERVARSLEDRFCVQTAGLTARECKHLVPRCLKMLTGLIVGSIPLLSGFHLEVLRALPKRQAFEFFTHDFLRSQLRCYFLGSPFPWAISPILELLELFQSRTSEQEYSRLFAVSPRFELPSMFADFDLAYMFFLVSPRDVQLLWKYATGVVTFPKVVHLTLRPEFLHRQPMRPVWLKLYQRGVTLRIDPARVVFDEIHETFPERPDFEPCYHSLHKLAEARLCHPIDLIERGHIHRPSDEVVGYIIQKSMALLIGAASSFEVFIRHATSFQRLEDFDAVSFAHFDAAMCEFCGLLSARDVSRFVRTPRAIRLGFMNETHAQCTPEVMGRWKGSCDKLERLWALALPATADFAIPVDPSGLLASVTVIPRLPLPRAFLLLLRCMFEIDRVRAGFGIGAHFAQFVVHSTRQPGFITTFLFLSGIFMKNNDFQMLCFPTELAVWYRFEEVVLDVVESSRELSRVYHDFEDLLLMAFASLS